MIKLRLKYETNAKPLDVKNGIEFLVSKASSYEGGMLENVRYENECLTQVVGALVDVLATMHGQHFVEQLLEKLPYGLEIAEDD
jgi:hypothetical protein